MRPTAALAAAALVLTGCGSSAADESRPVVVYAAASLSDVFDRLAADFRDEHPDAELEISYGGSSALARAIVQGAPVDVFASADPAQMRVVTDAGLAEEPAVFAANVLEIAVPPGNPGGVTGLQDFADPDLTLAVCAPQVPCGAAAERLFDAAGITARPDTQEEDVRAALTKVQLGEVDAALVYATDVRAAGDTAQGIPVDGAEQVVNEYPIAVLTGSAEPAAGDFVDLVLSDTGREALRAAGFRLP